MACNQGDLNGVRLLKSEMSSSGPILVPPDPVLAHSHHPSKMTANSGSTTWKANLAKGCYVHRFQLIKTPGHPVAIIIPSYLPCIKLVQKTSWNMESPKSTLQSNSPDPTSRFLKIGISPSIGPIRLTKTHEPGKRARTIFRSDRDQKLAGERETYRREKLAERDKRRKQSASNPGHSMAVNIKECLLEVQQVYLNQLAAEENHVTGVAEIPGALTIEFEKNRKEAERVVKRL